VEQESAFRLAIVRWSGLRLSVNQRVAWRLPPAPEQFSQR